MENIFTWNVDYKECKKELEYILNVFEFVEFLVVKQKKTSVKNLGIKLFYFQNENNLIG